MTENTILSSGRRMTSAFPSSESSLTTANGWIATDRRKEGRTRTGLISKENSDVAVDAAERTSDQPSGAA